MTAPANTVAPVITGSATVGATLTTDDGTWTGSPTTFTYAWLRAGVAIAGATTAAYTVTSDDVGSTLKSRVTASNVDGTAIADSAATGAVPSTLIVETGAGVVGADSYISVADANTYHASIGNIAWLALTAGVREASLRKAAAFMLGRYRFRWAGSRKTTTQTLDWPRSLVPIKDAPNLYGGSASYYDDASVPQAVKDACASLALRAASATLLADQSRTKKSVTIGPITTVYDDVAGQATQYVEVDAMVAPYLKAGGNQVEMVRR